MILPITLSAAGAAAIINIWLAMRCGQTRTKEKISMGDGGNEALISRMRAHANFVEYTPFFLILLALIEMAKGSSTWLWVVSGLFIIGRLAHAFGMDGWKPGRPVGTIITMLSLLGLGGYSLYVAHTSDGTVTEITPSAVTETLPEG